MQALLSPAICSAILLGGAGTEQMVMTTGMPGNEQVLLTSEDQGLVTLPEMTAWPSGISLDVGETPSSPLQFLM